jgi:hypothetical protein
MKGSPKMISLNPNNPWLPNNQQDLSPTSPYPSAYSALGTPTQNTYAVGTLPSTSGWDTYQAPYQAPAPNTLLATNTQTYTYAPNDTKTQTIAPDTRIYAPETTINYDSTTNQYYITHEAAPAPPPVYPPPVYPDPPKIELPKIQYPPQQSKKKEGTNWLPWLIGGGGILAALFLPKLFGKKDKVEAKAEATAPAKATPEAVEEKSKTPAKKGEVRVNFTGYGDPKFKDARTGKIIDITKAGNHTLVKDNNSNLSVHMTKDKAGNVYMDVLNYSVSGSDIKADDSGKVTVDGEAVKVGSTANLKNGGSVEVVAGTSGSTTNKKGKATIIIKTGTGENMTAFIQKRKTDDKPYYEFNFSKANDEDDDKETVTGGDLKPFFDDAPVTNKQTGRKLKVGDDTSDVA